MSETSCYTNSPSQVLVAKINDAVVINKTSRIFVDAREYEYVTRIRYGAQTSRDVEFACASGDCEALRGMVQRAGQELRVRLF